MFFRMLFYNKQSLQYIEFLAEVPQKVFAEYYLIFIFNFVSGFSVLPLFLNNLIFHDFLKVCSSRVIFLPYNIS